MTKQSILIISDSAVCPSGVAGQVRHIAKRLVKEGHSVTTIGAMTLQAVPPPVTHTFESGEQIKMYSHNRFDDMAYIAQVVKENNITAVILFQDPNKLMNIFANANYFWSQRIPLYYVSVWDTHLVPDAEGKQHYNVQLYETLDGIGCISKQTEWFTNQIFTQQKHGSKPYIHYVGHGSDPSVFKPLPAEELVNIRKQLFGDKQFDYVAFIANKNQGRKKMSDAVYAWNQFFTYLPKEQSDKCAFIIHSELSTEYGTDMTAVVAALAPKANIYLSGNKIDEGTLCKLYNVADVCLNVSNAEGFGLTTNEAMLCGRPIIANVTGGLVDQIGFFQDGMPVTWTPHFKEHWDEYSHGIWAYPLRNHKTIIGSPPTPYLWDENADIDAISSGFQYWHNMTVEQRKEFGLKGRQWCLDRGLNNKDFSINVVKGLNHVITNYQPKPLFNAYQS